MQTLTNKEGHNTLNKKNLIILLTGLFMALFIAACGNSSDENVDRNKDEEKITYQANKEKGDKTDRKKGEKTNHDNSGDKEKSGASDESSNQDQQTNEASEDDTSDEILKDYSPEEIE